MCRQAPARTGVLCEDCCEELWTPTALTPQQVERSGSGGSTQAALIDMWGRAHRLDPDIVIGRSSDHAALAVRESSISREHARLTLAPLAVDPSRPVWTLRDLGSVNGTFINDVQQQTARLRHRDKIRFGNVTMFFVDDATQLPPPSPDVLNAATFRIPESRSSSTGVFDVVPADLPSRSFQFQEPTGGGGGIVTIGAKRLQLSIPQFELIKMLADRMSAEANHPADTRGFVRASELLAELSLDARDPNENNIRQIVRRLRLVLIKAGIGDLIESRYRSGYRLRVTPESK
ncbi:MAG: FHA domain-containing protein [Kofleriaceae bacterium]